MRGREPGLIGYLLQQNLQNELFQRKINQNVATIITQVLVDVNDPAFQHPTKPIGGFMGQEEALRKKNELGWSVVEDAGRGWRRVVASPHAQRSRRAGYGQGPHRHRRSLSSRWAAAAFRSSTPATATTSALAAVIDKDFASSLLAQEINADLFIISTAVEKVALNFGKPNEKLVWTA